MSIHPALSKHSSLKFIKQFSKALYVLDTQLSQLGLSNWQVSVEEYSKQRGIIQKIFEGVDPKTISQSMVILSRLDDIDVQINISMINNGWLLPLEIYFELPFISAYQVECSRGAFKRKIISTPDNANLCKQVDRFLPNVRSKHLWRDLYVKLNMFYEIFPTENDTTLFIVRTGFKKKMFNKPKFDLPRYFMAATELEKILEE